MDWRAKYLVQRVLSFLPGDYGFRTNRFLSQRFGGLRNPGLWGIENTLAMCSLLRASGLPARGASFVELGTGWTAASALVLLGVGARSVHSFDLFRHLDDGSVARARQELRDIGAHLQGAFPFPFDLASVAAEYRDADADLSRFHYHAPHDARHTGLADGEVDCFFSQAVLEHIPEPVIAELLRESYRVLRPGGLCYHYVQPTMHAAWVDPRATGIDYLTCSDFVWRTFLDNDVAHENRLRAPRYPELVAAAGFEIVGQWKTVDRRALEALPAKRVAPRFRSYSPEELATDYVWILARKP